MIELLRKIDLYKSSTDVAENLKNQCQNVQLSHKPASISQLKDPVCPLKWTSVFQVPVRPRPQPKAGTAAVCVGSSTAAKTGMKTQTKARVSKISRTLIRQQVARSQSCRFHRP